MKKPYIFISVLVFVLFFTACTLATPNPPPYAPTSIQNLSATAPSMDGGQVVWATDFNHFLDPIRSSNSLSGQLAVNIMQGLTIMNPTVPYADVQGNLAHSWWRVDPNTWYFYLREGIYFHDGAYFDAHAVVLNIERVLDPDESVPQRNMVEMISGAVAVDNYTVRVTTHFPFAPLAATFAQRVLLMVSPYAIAQERAGGELVARNPIGTGPFQFYSREHNRETILVRNENYWGTPAAPDSVRVVVIPEPSTRFAMLGNGEVHFIIGTTLDYGDAQSFQQIDARLLEGNTLDYIGFNMNHPILSDIRVRRGIAYAIDRQYIVGIVAHGFGLGTLAHTPAAPILAHAPQGQSTDYDPARAAELFEQAGITPSNRVTLEFWYNGGNLFRNAVGDFLQTTLAPYGIDVVVSAIEWSAFLEQTGEGLHDMFVLGWTTGSGDTDGAVYSMFHSSNLGANGNRSFFVNEHADYLMDRARASMDGVERDMLYEELIEIINYYQPMVFLRYTLVPVLTNGIDNLHVAFDQTPHFRDVTFR